VIGGPSDGENGLRNQAGFDEILNGADEHQADHNRQRSGEQDDAEQTGRMEMSYVHQIPFTIAFTS
jgi:hypothetical protein